MKISPEHTIGIWGLGVSGQSIMRYCIGQHARVVVLNQHAPSPEIAQFLTTHACIFYHDPQDRDKFFALCDTVVPSPGIDLAQLPPEWQKKCSTELDIFYQAWHEAGHTQGIERKIIAITGTVGKTSITHLLTNLLQQAGVAAIAGGNIGTGMLDLLDHQEATHAVLELSSFQLEQSREFAPDLAIWTNLYANHLDRHKTMQAYAAAKAQIFCRQTNGQQALLPLAARAIIEPVIACEPQASKPLHAWFSSNPEPAAPAPENFFYRNTATGAFMYHQRKNTQYILSTEEIPSISFAENWLIIAAAATLLGFDARTFIAGARVPDLPHNRLEPVATVPGITFINDSKSTIIQATIAAIEALAPQSIILLLGGLSKGVDRIPYLGQLRTTGAVRHVICFGAEAQALFAGCQQAGLPASCCATLEEAVTLAYEQARLEQKNTCVLLSPGGTSFDLFKNYEERGTRFTELAKALL